MTDQIKRRDVLQGLAAAGLSAAFTGAFLQDAEAAAADELTFGTTYGFTDLNPLQKVGHPSCYIFFDALTILESKTQKVLPRLAQSWKLIDPLTTEFVLVPGVKFSDGTALTADDVKFSIDITLSEKLAMSSLLSSIAKVEVVDPTTLRVITKTPDPIIERRLAMLFVVPRRAYTEAGTDKFGYKPIGTGQYICTQLTPGNVFVAEASPTSWRGAPATRKMTWRLFQDQSAFMASVQAGQIDIAQNLPSQALRSGMGAEFTVQSVNVGSPFVIQLNTTKPPFNDVRVRRAMNMALDRDTFIRVVLNGGASRLNGQLPGPGCFGNDPSLTDYPFDLTAARQLLKEAGYEKGFETEIFGQIRDRALLEALSGQFAKLGVTVKVNALDYSVWSESFTKGSPYPMYTKGLDYSPLFDAESSYQWVTVGQPGRQGWIDAKWDGLLAQSRAELDDKKREAILKQMAAYLRDEAPFVFLFNNQWTYAVRKSVQNLDLNTGKWIDCGKITKTS